MKSKRFLRRVGIEVLGWTLVVVGLAALVLPGPGLLCLFAGLAVLSQQYEWAERRLRPVEVMALKSAAQGVETWPRIVASCIGALAIGAVGIVWGIRPDVPGWWPLAERWWLPGGWGTGATLIASSLMALALIVYSYKRFHGLSEQEAQMMAERLAKGETSS
ncbi:PGPGW domain-containing protein [Aeromicrobium wangtongii]|uniref:PGPGW domain-containing protein n=1 Tax=Aeromicrobium wangtongii TaxID=2969247 RepID=A0ABY5MCD5_9ACTN|nr:PGPGW domain-containing protein [Aeromicrobium wangtongii]MCD9199847.1 PGPGW domain-containing protein [Aeromicrobium wangtongii]UUP13466.1 PGPGW domain-containing protein [Aeromicrobium wangtongii]